MTAPLRGLVLAGGASSRMGRDKALLRWGGQTLLARAVALLLQSGCDEVWVSGDYPGYACISDPVPGLGPLAGLWAAAEALADGPLMVVPVDMPLLTAELLAALRDADGDCAHFRDHPLPLKLTLSSECSRTLRELAGAPDAARSLRGLTVALQATQVPIPPERAGELLGANRPGEWQALLAQSGTSVDSA